MPDGDVFWWVSRERIEERGRAGIVRLEQRTVVRISQRIDKKVCRISRTSHEVLEKL